MISGPTVPQSCRWQLDTRLRTNRGEQSALGRSLATIQGAPLQGRGGEGRRASTPPYLAHPKGLKRKVMAPRQVPPGGPKWMGRWALGSACRALSGGPSWAGEPCAAAQAWAGARWCHRLQAWDRHCSQGPLPAATFATLSLACTCTWIIPWTWGSQELGCPGARTGGRRVDRGGRRPRRAGHSAQAQAGSLEPQHHGLTCTGSNPPTALTCACSTPPHPKAACGGCRGGEGTREECPSAKALVPSPGTDGPKSRPPSPGHLFPDSAKSPRRPPGASIIKRQRRGHRPWGHLADCSARIPGVGVAWDLAGPPLVTAAGPLLLARPGGIPLALGRLWLLHPCW
nr:uncharacterized protein LOC112914609 [Vulpes vulpes]